MGARLSIGQKGILTPEQLVEKSPQSCKIAGIEASYHQTGGAVLVDPSLTWTVTKESMIRKWQNTPFINSELTGESRASLFLFELV